MYSVWGFPWSTDANGDGDIGSLGVNCSQPTGPCCCLPVPDHLWFSSCCRTVVACVRYLHLHSHFCSIETVPRWSRVKLHLPEWAQPYLSVSCTRRPLEGAGDSAFSWRPRQNIALACTLLPDLACILLNNSVLPFRLATTFYQLFTDPEVVKINPTVSSMQCFMNMSQGGDVS